MREYEEKMANYDKEIENAKRLSLDSRRKEMEISSIKQKLNDTLEEFELYRNKAEEWEKRHEKELRLSHSQSDAKVQQLVDEHSTQISQLEQLIQVLSNTIIDIYTCILAKNSDIKVLFFVYNI